jgi:hypothetical protein
MKTNIRNPIIENKFKNTTDYTDVEKTRILLKLNWEGGLLGYMSYGIAPRLYLKFKDEFDYFYSKEDLIRSNHKKLTKQFKEFKEIINNYLTVPNVKYTDDELNAVNYVFDEAI